MRIGILTGGGDCPGLNAVIRAIVCKCVKDFGSDVIGYLEGWRGPIENMVMPLTVNNTAGLLSRGGTIIRTSRENPFKVERGPERVLESMQRNSLEALIAIGGEETCAVADRMFKEHKLPVVCIPKTIDNDLNGTDYTFGFDTAVNIVMESLDRLHTTAESHNRVLVCEVMGGNAGWIATYGGIAGGAHYIAIPEKPLNIGELLSDVKKRHSRGSNYSIIVVAEGTKLEEGPAAEDVCNGSEEKPRSIGETIARLVEKQTGYETRAMVLGHIQRGGSPTAFDRVLATRFGVKAAEMAHEKKFGLMAALRGNLIEEVPIGEGTGDRQVDMQVYEVAKVFFG
jgi:6-phosphofructokinase 1